MASFITSYARLKTIRSAQKIMDNKRLKKSKAEFCYADTDSLHINLNGEDIDEMIGNLKKYKLNIGDFYFENKSINCLKNL